MSVMISTNRSRSGAFVDTYDCDDVWPLGDGRIVFKASMGSDTCKSRDYRWHLGCILPRVPARSLRTGVDRRRLSWTMPRVQNGEDAWRPTTRRELPHLLLHCLYL